MAKFTDGNPFLVEKKHLTQPWGGMTDGRNFRCALCGYRFKEGDTVRWQYANNIIPNASGNFFVCTSCDGPDILSDWSAHIGEFYSDKFWYFRR